MSQLVPTVLAILVLVPLPALASTPSVQVDALESSFHDTKPGVPTTMTFAVRNTGSTTDTYALTIWSKPAGWSATPSVASITLGPHASGVVTVTVTPQLPVLSGHVGLRAASPDSQGQTGGWVRMPVEVTALTRDVTDGLRNDPQVRGNVTVKWTVDGTPAVGAPMAMHERSAAFGIYLEPDDPLVLAYGDARTTYVTVGPNGKAAYRLPANLLGANQPGYHYLGAIAATLQENEGSHTEMFYYVDPTQ
ncbi:MAG TPA: hypothetical protein VI997_06430 [Candidatus Thermoplasmatota archaeon]|nr:hypothetical protein [Candidatus Thermoplasmatota archaeon]